MPPGSRLGLRPQVAPPGGLLRLAVGHREGVEAQGRQHPLHLKDQGALPVLPILRLGHAGNAPVVPQRPLEGLGVPLRLLQQHEGQKIPRGAGLLQSGLPLLPQREVGPEQHHLAVPAPLETQP